MSERERFCRGLASMRAPCQGMRGSSARQPAIGRCFATPGAAALPRQAPGAARTVEGDVGVMGEEWAQLVQAHQHDERHRVAARRERDDVRPRRRDHAAVGQHRVRAHQHLWGGTAARRAGGRARWADAHTAWLRRRRRRGGVLSRRGSLMHALAASG